MEVENGPLEDHWKTTKQVVFHFHVSFWECSTLPHSTKESKQNRKDLAGATLFPKRNFPPTDPTIRRFPKTWQGTKRCKELKDLETQTTRNKWMFQYGN